MSNNSDYFFLNLKQLYPNLCQPAKIDVEIWEEILEPFSQDEIYAALKSYRKSSSGNFAPMPSVFKDYLSPYVKRECQEPSLPLSPETYLMDEDIKAGRCKHLFPTYARAVQYVLNEKLKEAVGEETFATYTPGQRYRQAVDLGLFADFDEVLDLVYREKY